MDEKLKREILKTLEETKAYVDSVMDGAITLVRLEIERAEKAEKNEKRK